MTELINIEQKVQGQTLALCPELREQDGIVLAISGGLDSMVLLEIFHQLASRNNWRLVAGHLNHCLRGQESDRDEEYVKEQCSQRAIPCISHRADITALADAESISIEAAARRARYDFLSRVCQENNCQYLVTAHHADDNAETVLQRIIRGTGIKGLAGIKPFRKIITGTHKISLLRPLLNITRVELEDYSRKSGLSYCHDSSNDSLDYTRNQIRNSLLPTLAGQFNPAISKSLNNLSRIASDSDIILGELADIDLCASKAKVAPGILEVELERLNKLTPGRCRNLLRNALEIIGMPMIDVGFQNINDLQIACSDNRSRKLNQLPGDFQAEINNNRLIVTEISNSKSYLPIKLNIPGTTSADKLFTIDDMAEIIAITIENIYLSDFDLKEFFSTKTSHQEIIDQDKIVGELVLGALQPGLRYQPLGMTGSQRTGDIMTNRKIPRYLRNSIATISDNDGIIAIAGLRVADRVKIDSNSVNGLLLSFAVQSD